MTKIYFIKIAETSKILYMKITVALPQKVRFTTTLIVPIEWTKSIYFLPNLLWLQRKLTKLQTTIKFCSMMILQSIVELITSLMNISMMHDTNLKKNPAIYWMAEMSRFQPFGLIWKWIFPSKWVQFWISYSKLHRMYHEEFQ